MSARANTDVGGTLALRDDSDLEENVDRAERDRVAPRPDTHMADRDERVYVAPRSAHVGARLAANANTHVGVNAKRAESGDFSFALDAQVGAYRRAASSVGANIGRPAARSALFWSDV